MALNLDARSFQELSWIGYQAAVPASAFSQSSQDPGHGHPQPQWFWVHGTPFGQSKVGWTESIDWITEWLNYWLDCWDYHCWFLWLVMGWASWWVWQVWHWIEVQVSCWTAMHKTGLKLKNTHMENTWISWSWFWKSRHWSHRINPYPLHGTHQSFGTHTKKCIIIIIITNSSSSSSIIHILVRTQKPLGNDSVMIHTLCLENLWACE